MSSAAAEPGSREMRPKPLRLLILGGTAFIGIHMVQIARQRGHSVTLFNRGQARPDVLSEVESLKGDRNGPLDALKGRDWDAVIDNCGYVPRHVRMSAELLAPRVRQYLFVSTISVYADFTTTNDETSAVATVEDEECEDWRNNYGPLKALCERAAQIAMPDRTTIVRPGLIVGPQDPTDRFTYWPVRAARGGEILAPGNSGASYQVIDARDLAIFCLNAVENGVVGVFNATSPSGLFTMADIVRESVMAARTLATPTSPPRPTWVPENFLIQHKVQPFVDLPGWVPESGDMRCLYHTRVERAINAGLRISSLRTTIRDTLSWHLERQAREVSSLRAGMAPERERELLASWHSRS